MGVGVHPHAMRVWYFLRLRWKNRDASGPVRHAGGLPGWRSVGGVPVSGADRVFPPCRTDAHQSHIPVDWGDPWGTSGLGSVFLWGVLVWWRAGIFLHALAEGGVPLPFFPAVTPWVQHFRFLAEPRLSNQIAVSVRAAGGIPQDCAGNVRPCDSQSPDSAEAAGWGGLWIEKVLLLLNQEIWPLT